MINEESDRLQFKVKLGEKVAKNFGYDSEYKHPLKLLFDLNNVKLMVVAFIKKRPHNVRAQILLLCVALFNYMFIQSAPHIFLFQFTQKIYNWDVKTFSYMSSIGLFVNSFVAIVIGPVLIKAKYALSFKLV